MDNPTIYFIVKNGKTLFDEGVNVTTSNPEQFLREVYKLGEHIDVNPLNQDGGIKVFCEYRFIPCKRW